MHALVLLFIYLFIAIVFLLGCQVFSFRLILPCLVKTSDPKGPRSCSICSPKQSFSVWCSGVPVFFYLHSFGNPVTGTSCFIANYKSTHQRTLAQRAVTSASPSPPPREC